MMTETLGPRDVARSASDLQRILDDCRQGFAVHQVPAAEADQWCVIDGALQHKSRGFFSVNAISDGHESYVLLYQPQSAVTGLLSCIVGNERWFLLQARAEPGCLGGAQFGPTVQSTPANFMRMHGGATTPYVDAFIAFDPSVSIIDDTTQLDLGERYLFKSKRCVLAETRSPASPHKAFVWAAPQAICEAVQRSTFLNMDLRSIFSIANWSPHAGAADLVPQSEAVRKSLAAAIRPDVLGDLLSQLQRAAGIKPKFIPLDAADNWYATEMGWRERERRQGFGIDFFAVTAAYREVGRWVQPLVNSSGEGQVILACRERNGVLEFFVRAAAERGLATTSALAPSFVRYPGAIAEPPAWLLDPQGKLWCSTTESDEGGRFYRDASVYQVIRVDDSSVPRSETGTWVTLSELKTMLRMSNVCTIQLRGIVAHLLAVK
jgi:dTDP-4-dehydro-6-deoxy-alpha-D-glucopyranose 2,3-dehydratase